MKINRLDDKLFTLPIDNDYFLSYVFPSEDIIRYVPTQEYDVNAIIHKKIIVFCDQGEGKTALVRALVEEAIQKYGEDNVNAVVSSGNLSDLINYGFDDKLVQIHFCDDFTKKKNSDETIQDYFGLRHIWKRRIHRSYGLIVSVFGLHRFHSSQMEIRSTSNVVIIRNDSINPYDHNVIRRFIGKGGLRDLEVMQENRDLSPLLKSYSVFRARTGRIGLLYFPLAERDYLRGVQEITSEHSRIGIGERLPPLYLHRFDRRR